MKVSNNMNYIRVVQKNGKALVGEDFTPLVADQQQVLISPAKTKQPSTTTTMKYKSRTDMHKDRKVRDMRLLTG